MIGFLKGLLIEKRADKVLIDVHGVGYEIEVPASSLCALPITGQQTELHILTHVREDAIRLFGFASFFDKKIFESLIEVSGVGPKAALALLGALDGLELCDVIIAGDVSRLTAIPGVGGKTADRLILELKTKLQKLKLRYQANINSHYEKSTALFAVDSINTVKTSKGFSQELMEDLKSALVNLGYKDKQFISVVQSIEKRIEKGEEIALEVALKESLRKLSEHVLKN